MIIPEGYMYYKTFRPFKEHKGIVPVVICYVKGEDSYWYIPEWKEGFFKKHSL